MLTFHNDGGMTDWRALEAELEDAPTDPEDQPDYRPPGERNCPRCGALLTIDDVRCDCIDTYPGLP